MSNYIFNPPQQNYHDNQKIDLGDIRVSVLTNVEIPEGVSQVIFNNNTIVDMSYDNVVPEVVHNGYMFHAANGNICTGTYDPMEFPNHNLFVYINPSNFSDPLSNCYNRYSLMAASNLFNNHGIYMGDYVTNCNQMFNGSTYYNQPVIIGNNVLDCFLMFSGCANFNQPINMPDTVNTCYRMFFNCIRFNQPVRIGNSVEDCSQMFSNCINFNQSVIIPDMVTNCFNMFFACNQLNEPVTIGNNIINCQQMFYSCTNFNQPINIPDSVADCQSMFYSCYNFDQQIILGNNVTGCAGMFYGCTRFNNNIYIKSTKITNAYRILGNPDNSKRKRIFCTNLTPFTKTSSSTSITGTSISWISTTNGYYNKQYNIYLYNNLPEDI